GREDLRQVTLLLRRGPVFHERGPEHRHAATIDQLRRLGGRHLLVEDDHLDDRRAAPAELARPVEADVARLAHALLPGAELPDLVAVGARGGERAAAQVVRQVGLEPAADLLAERLFAVAEVEVHWEKGAPPPSRLPCVPARRRLIALFLGEGGSAPLSTPLRA